MFLCTSAPEVVAASSRAVLARYFDELAALEAASIDALDLLHRDLRAHDAPLALVAGALGACEDEKQHARMLRRLASSFGGHPKATSRAPLAAARTLHQIASANAVGGCVGKTYGAVAATMQAHNARDTSVRQAMAHIAADDTRHAGLAWSVHEWSMDRLDEPARAAVDDAMVHAFDELTHRLARPIDPVLREVAGRPLPEEAVAALLTLRVALGFSR
jgi:hypothetical protein